MSKRVLAVDDSKTMRDMVSFALRNAGFEVEEAEDGNVALGKLDAEKFDLIITDLKMPNMDGISLIKTVRAGTKHRAVPILILTTERDCAKMVDGKAAGATGSLVKPFSPEKLIELVRRICP
jgi:two-component system, chemotaxis family, chemotaxis protein CheY